MTDALLGTNGHGSPSWPDAPAKPDPWPPPMGEAAYHGVTQPEMLALRGIGMTMCSLLS